MTGEPDNSQEAIIKEAVRQFAEAHLRGERPDIGEFVKMYPSLDGQIREGISHLEMINKLFDTLGQPDPSEFADPVDAHTLIGQKVGSFDIIEMIGRGGMGVVYLARDTRLKRTVAIKSIPTALTHDATARRRFQREAELLAALNHPNIAVIHEIIEQDEGSGYLVLEYVPGRTLAEQMAHKALRLEEALSIAQQIAEALQGAYEQGVIHRDLKPGNIMITPEGRVKVLDFGLAKATETQDEKPQSAITQPGRIMGTPAYMSPEQARGNPTDHRTDIWSFGCVMYEMLCGRLPFEADTATDILARVLEREPDWQALPPATPPNVRLLLRRCLEKDPRQRLQHMGDAALEIRETLNLPAVVPPMTVSAMTVTQAGTARRSIMTKAATLALTAIIAGLITWSWFGPSPPPGPVKLSIPLAPKGKAGLIHAGNIRLVLSPDGKLLVLSDPADEKKQLYLRSLDNFEIKPIPGTENAYDPFFSPKGQWLAFFTQDAPDKHSLWKLRMNQNGSKVFIAEIQHAIGQGTWSDDDVIFFCGGDADDDDNLPGIFQVSANEGGTPERLSTVNSESAYYFYPRVLPDGKTIMYNAGGGTICLLSRVTGKSTVLIHNANGAQYSHTGHLLFNRYNQLFAVPFDTDTLKETGPEVLVVRDVPAPARHSLWHFSMARNGTLAYVPLPSEASSLVWVDPKGNTAPVAGLSDGGYSNPRLSPDDTELAVMIQENDRRHIWQYDLKRNFPTQRTSGRLYTLSPDWVPPDAHRISFSSTVQVGTVVRPQLRSLSVDGTGKPEPLAPDNLDFWRAPLSWSPDGKYLAYYESHSTTPTSRIWILPFGDSGKPGKPALFLDDKHHIREAKFRPPDGRCIAYSSDKTGRDEIYLKEFLWGNLSEGWVEKISSGGGKEPCWSRDGSKLFYRGANGMMEIPVHANQDGTIDVGESRVLFPDSIYSTGRHGHTNYDVTLDGRFIMVEDVPPTQINVILNWAEELKRLAPTVKD